MSKRLPHRLVRRTARARGNFCVIPLLCPSACKKRSAADVNGKKKGVVLLSHVEIPSEVQSYPEYLSLHAHRRPPPAIKPISACDMALRARGEQSSLMKPQRFSVASFETICAFARVQMHKDSPARQTPTQRVRSRENASFTVRVRRKSTRVSNFTLANVQRVFKSSRVLI